MITNNAPTKMQLHSIVAAYSKVYIQHSIYSDYDVIGKSFWLYKTNILNDPKIRKDFTDVSNYFVVLDTLLSDTAYSIYGSFYDAIIDSELLSAEIGINISDIYSFTTKRSPTIVSTACESPQVDIGTGSPIVLFNTDGEADYCVIEIQDTSSSLNPWTKVYTGPLTREIKVGSIPVGSYKARISGFINLPDGVTSDSSGIHNYSGIVNVSYNFSPPSAATNILFKAARIHDGKERYDVRVEWSWDKGNGSNVREFVLYYVSSKDFTSTQWAKAQKINVGAAKAATITSFPWKTPYKFKVSAIAWGPDAQSITDSIVVDFTLDENTQLDSSFINDTGIEVTYAYIKGKILDNGTYKQTFLIDAATGAVNIGLLDAQGKAPISFDPVSKTVNVDGNVITKSINSASFILTNLTGKDNPAFYSQGKSYGDTNAGIWIGIDNTTAKPKLDIGNSRQYIRFDGDTLKISGEVTIGTPNGDISMSEGLQGKQTVFIYKLASSLPEKPLETSYPPTGWFTIPPNRVSQNDNIYACTGLLDPVTNSLVTGKSWSDVVQWSGTEGTNGIRGPGFYAQALPTLASFDITQANAFFQANFGSTPVKYDVMTQYLTTNPAIAFTKQWDGTTWVNANVLIHGNMIVNGTITTDKIIGSDAFLSQIGVNTVYDREAALSANPEANYKMKISLVDGYIHIR